MSANDPRQPHDSTPPVPPPADPVEGDSLAEIDLGNEGAIEFGELPPSQEASRVALAQLPDPPSAQSLTTWTEVIRRQRAAQEEGGGSGSMRVDAPSDKDLLNRLASDSKTDGLKRPGDTSEILPADMPVFSRPPSGDAAEESAIDLGRALAGRAAGGSEVRFDILYPPSDAGGAIPLPADVPPLSSSDFPKGTAVPVPFGTYNDAESIPFALAVGPGLSGLDLGSDMGVPGDDGRSSILDVLLSESKLVETPAPPVRSYRPTMPTGGAGPDKIAIPTQPGIDVPDEPLDLSDPDSTFGPRTDDSVDLLAEGASPPSLTDSGTLEISDQMREQAQRRNDQLESSAIDLDSHPSGGSAFDLEVESDRRKKSDAEIDLDLPPLEDGSASALHPQEPLAANQEAIAAEFRARRQQPAPAAPVRPRPQRNQLVPLREPSTAGRNKYFAFGGALGLLVGAGIVLLLSLAGVLPGRNDRSAADAQAEAARLRQEADSARADAADARTQLTSATAGFRKSLIDAGVANPDRPGDALRALVAAKTTSDSRIQQLTTQAKKNLAAAEAAQKTANEATNNLTVARRQLDDAGKAADAARKAADAAQAELAAARKELTDTRKAADDRVTKIQADAEAKEKVALARVDELMKRDADHGKALLAAKNAANQAVTARNLSDTTLKEVADRLTRAKFAGEKPDAAALVKGLDDALKAVTTDATSSLRDELAAARTQETKLKTDLAAAREKEAEATKAAAAQKAEAQRLAADLARSSGDSERLTKQAADATAKAAAAGKIADAARAEAEQLAADTGRLKTENDRLTRDLEAVRELAELLKAAPATTGPSIKLEPAKLADRFFSDGLRAYHAGRYPEAESAFRKAVQFRPDDARHHYLLGLALWMTRDTAAAEAEFEKGRDLELAGRPSSRTVSAVLERIQGPARQAVNAYRP